jgi:hypothetical protein
MGPHVVFFKERNATSVPERELLASSPDEQLDRDLPDINLTAALPETVELGPAW